MAMQRWNEREQDWRGASDWRDRDDYRGRREARRFEEGHNPAGPAQNYHPGEDRSWTAGDRYYGDYGRQTYGEAGPTGYPRQDYLGDARRFDQGYDRDRYGETRYGNEGRSGQTYGYDRSDYGPSAYGSQWNDRQGYGADGRSGYGQDYGQSRYGQGGDYRGGAYGEYGQRQFARGRDIGFGDPNPYVQAATDGLAQGEHRGRGPADYKRSDDRIREDINDRLTDDAHIDASGIQVAVKDGEVTLSGMVDNRFAKRHAEDLADHISGAKHVQNNLRIRDARSMSASSSTATTGSTASGRA